MESDLSLPSASSPFMTREAVDRILASEAPYRDDSQKQTCQRMISELTEEEQELAARTSFAYFVFITSFADCPSPEMRERMAMREARRHLVAEDGNYDKALATLRSTCQYRKERRLDLFKTCFVDNAAFETPEDTEQALQYRAFLTEELSRKQPLVVRGMDRGGRAIVMKFPRKSDETDPDAYIAANLYITERAVAATEFLTFGTQEKVTAVLDFANYSSAHSPPLRAIQTVVSLLQGNYPERLEHAIVLNAPTWVRILFTFLKPFMSLDTREKIRMASSDKEKKDMVSPLISDDQAMPFLIPNGQLTDTVDSNRFLERVPFHRLYDDVDEASSSSR